VLNGRVLFTGAQPAAVMESALRQTATLAAAS
jgi:hypothetical protein